MTNDYIDIIITVLLTREGQLGSPRRDGYLKHLLKSINKFTNYPYKIHIVTDVRNEEEQTLFDELKDSFSDREDVFLLKSINKNKDINDVWVYTEKDKRRVGVSSINKSLAYETGIRNSSGKYVCLLDYDCVFLNEWTEMILPLTEKYFFVSAMWRGDLNIARDQFFIYKRNKFEDINLMPDCTIGDTSGNVSHYAIENNLEFYICKNSSSWGDKSLTKEHLVDLGRGEQIWVDSVPFLYHYGRGSSKDDYWFDLWNKEVGKYLEDK